MQSIDVFTPKLKTGIEYQVIQPYEPVNFFGGSEALKHRIKLDFKKKELCELNKIKLIYWDYSGFYNA